MENSKPGCLGAILQMFGLLPSHTKAVDEILPYAKRDDFLSPSELSFYKVLGQAITEKQVICPKVALKDIFFIKSGDMKVRKSYLNKIDRKHVDFLVCSAENMAPIFGVELDDSSHQRPDRIDRDRFVDEVFKTAGLGLLRFKNQYSYSLQEVKEKLEPLIKVEFKEQDFLITEIKTENDELAITSEATNPVQTVSVNSVPICPKCGIPMVERVAKTGERKGQAFYGCSNFPRCKELINRD